MRSQRRRLLQSIDQATRRLEAIEWELEQIRRSFPDLKRPRRGRAGRPEPRDRGVPRQSGPAVQVRGLRVH